MKDVLDWVILIIKFAISLVCLYIHFHIKDIKRFIPALIFFFICITVMVFYKLNWFNISYRLNLSVNILYVCFLVLSYYTVYIKDLNIPSLHDTAKLHIFHKGTSGGVKKNILPPTIIQAGAVRRLLQ